MQRLSPIIALLLLGLNLSGQSPHGELLKMDCAQCHHPNGWEIDPKTIAFRHDSTNFPLEGRHASLDCKSCHLKLVFETLSSDCIGCHQDPHEQTVGQDCKRCHTQTDWLVDDTRNLHLKNGFPLLGTHAQADCASCHTSPSRLRFDRIGNDCIQCHRQDYVATTQPNHQQAGYEEKCATCHDPAASQWKAENFVHDFFPLTGGHANQACKACHQSPDYASTPTDCIACHQDDYKNSLNPNHPAARLGEQCNLCHTTDPDWKPSRFEAHDGLYFPIYSGEHKGEWNQCNQCHLNNQNYQEFSCTVCHKNPETDEEHKKVRGYFFNDQACLACHPQGDNLQVFDHNNTQFPLTQAHLDVQCISCHQSGFKGTSTDCFACHEIQYTSSTNPSHTKLQLSHDCKQCHSTAPDWKPALFTQHDQYYELKEAHRLIANECSSCHQGNYNTTPNTCVGCHLSDYNQTTDPSHVSQQFSTQCTDCHSEKAWAPANFNHDGNYFPIYTGAHRGTWIKCSDCHTNPGNFKLFSCTVCHLSGDTDPKHDAVVGYWYQDNACLACHPTGDNSTRFDHNSTNFPLTGAHLQTECKACHASGFKGTPSTCSSCHQTDYDKSTNPNHGKLGFGLDCAQCHTTQADWQPAKLDQHNQYYELKGAHTQVATDCKLCHQGDYNNTPTDCRGCHLADYNNSQSPPHASQKLPTECAICHSENAWIPSNFQHDGMYFPIYTGAHRDEWITCQDCHTTPGQFNQFSCTVCHINPQTDGEHVQVSGYWYQDQACFACHPTGAKTDRFNHDATGFPLTGAHLSISCKECHESGFKGTPNQCMSCHQSDFEASQDPDHRKLNLSNDCIQCHTTQPDWQPARFDQHDQIYPIQGAHKTLDCANCHQGKYQNTPNTCQACHLEDYNKTTDPAHNILKFSTECASCHTQNAWVPSTFDHDGMHFPIYSGKHQGQWMECRDCHINPTDIKVFTCINCHDQVSTGEDHRNVNGYWYQDQACLACHPTGSKDDRFDHNLTAFPLTGAHTVVDCKSCHTSGLKGTPTDCKSCHQNHFNGTLNPDHRALNLSDDCAVCHSTQPDWKPARFDQHDQYYVLQGAHRQIANDCAKCHQGNYQQTPNTCSGCHIKDYNEAKNPDHIALQFSADCAVCHTESAWKPSTFDHDGMYFPIYTGKHKGEWTDCVDCHTNPSNYKEFVCITCHINPETDEKHLGVTGYFYSSQACFACHPTGSKDDMFDHNNTMFPLTGAHKVVECKACHANGFKGTPTDCQSCHLPDYGSTTNPSHSQLGLPTECEQCHTTAPGWKPALFPNHDNYYPLTGRHLEIANECSACHQGNYKNTPNTCEGCHLNDYNQAKNPNHNTLGLSKDCAVCHTTQPGWQPAQFPDHDSYYPLTGRHQEIEADCAACHHGNYNNTPNTCEGCHLNDYNQSKNPSHPVLGLSKDCAACHTTQPGWAPALFPVHDSYYPLTGAHLSIASDCAACHHGNYNNTPSTCEGCHLNDYNGATNPSHINLNLSKDCAVCHTTNPGWEPALFPNHDNYYPLVGAHFAIKNDCAICHNGNYNNTPNTCQGCHLDDYNQTSNPDHQVQQYPLDCEVCHTQIAWIPSNFNHNNYYPLTGGHDLIKDDCIACHMGNYNNTPTTCNGCHQDDFNQTTNPNHVSLGFTNNCTYCHTTNPGWEPALMPNHDSYYPLLGAHASIKNNCDACHNGDYNNTPNTCVGCHLDDYNQTTNPDHQSAQFPTDCQLCHTQNAWIPSTFNHAVYFPIYTGKHKDEWNTCSDCHTNPNNYNIFSCIDCHEHNNKNEVDDEHSGVSGYQYNSNACYACHPDGKK